MLFSRLKMQIAVTLTVLLTVAILLGNIVVIAFGQKGMVRSEIEHVRSVLQSVQSFDHLQESLQIISAGVVSAWFYPTASIG